MSDDPPASGQRQQSAVGRWTHGALTALVSITMFAMMALTTIDVAGRAFFNAPMRGNFEIVTFLLAILVFASLPLVTWDEKHITVNLFDRWIPRAVKRGLDVVLSAVSTLVLAAVTYRLWIQANLMAEGQHVTGFLEWPIAPVVYFTSVMSAFASVILAIITVRKLTGRGQSAAEPANRWGDARVE